MTRTLVLALAAALSLSACATAPDAPSAAAVQENAAALSEAVAGSWRTPANVARDGYRHPRETLAFFGVEPGDTVVEITPGGGWYSEILAPYLRARGRYVAAIWDDAIAGQPAYRYRANTALREKFAGNAAVYGAPVLQPIEAADRAERKPGQGRFDPGFGHRLARGAGQRTVGQFVGHFAAARAGGKQQQGKDRDNTHERLINRPKAGWKTPCFALVSRRHSLYAGYERRTAEQPQQQ